LRDKAERRKLKVYLTRMPKGPRCHDGQWRTTSNVQDNKGTAEASQKGKEGGKEGEEARQQGRYVECSTEVSVCHVVPVNLQYPFG
jgi:hypothetical protein